MISKLFLILAVLVAVSFVTNDVFAQITSGGFGNSPFERDFGDVKFLDAYFGLSDEKIEVSPGDTNVPLLS